MSEREPTSHERQAGAWWDDSYRDRTAPWDIGRPQQAFERLARDGRWSGAILDAGCGSGEHTLLAASLGLSALGVDVAATALEMAWAKGRARGGSAEFALADARHLERLDRTFDTVLDCGLFHTFDEEERRVYVASLAAVTEPGATLFVLCFRDGAPESEGPHPVTEAELRAAFVPDAGWRLADLQDARIEVTFDIGSFPAWLVTVHRA
ncbi:MAG: class I SAM-dependent methyltransferase [Actinobacteria bacterium]|nr:class I SAM-dependent methyltransferase [Actinomycetota bacterium]